MASVSPEGLMCCLLGCQSETLASPSPVFFPQIISLGSRGPLGKIRGHVCYQRTGLSSFPHSARELAPSTGFKLHSMPVEQRGVTYVIFGICQQIPSKQMLLLFGGPVTVTTWNGWRHSQTRTHS